MFRTGFCPLIEQCWNTVIYTSSSRCAFLSLAHAFIYRPHLYRRVCIRTNLLLQLQMWSTLPPPHPQTPKSLLSLKPHLWPRVSVSGSYQVSPFPPKSLTHFSSMSDSDPPPLPTPLALTQAYCSLSAARLNSDCWLEAETEKEALGVFIETLSFTRTITTLPHRERERHTHTHKQTDFWFCITEEKCTH